MHTEDQLETGLKTIKKELSALEAKRIELEKQSVFYEVLLVLTKQKLDLKLDKDKILTIQRRPGVYRPIAKLLEQYPNGLAPIEIRTKLLERNELYGYKRPLLAIYAALTRHPQLFYKNPVLNKWLLRP